MDALRVFANGDTDYITKHNENNVDIAVGITVCQFDDYRCYFPGTPISEILVRYSITRDTILPAGLTGSQGYAWTAPSGGSPSLQIYQNLTFIGSIDFADGQHVPTFTFDDLVTLEAGQVLAVYNGEDHFSFADISITLVGTRVL